MTGMVFAFAVLNVALGFVLAVVAAPPRKRAARRLVIAAPKPAAPREAPPREVDIESLVTQAIERAAEEAEEPIPEEWLETLKHTGVEASSFVEASVQVLRLQVAAYRERLLGIERLTRECMEDGNYPPLAAIAEKLRAVNADWTSQQASALDHLQTRRGRLGTFEEMGGLLEDVLLDQTAQIETTLSNVAAIDFANEPRQGGSRFACEVCRLIDLTHTLRDRMQESMVSIMLADRKLDSLDREHLTDPLTRIPNRNGLEKLLLDWWRDDIRQERMIAAALIDIDHFSRVNGAHGTHAGDRLLAAVANVLQEAMRKERGFDVATRYSGQQFVLLFGNTGPRGATSGVERIRQLLEKTTFEYDGLSMEITVSCAVVEATSFSRTRELMKKLKATLREAKRSGRNRTFLDEGRGAENVEPPEFSVRGRIVHVAEE